MFFLLEFQLRSNLLSFTNTHYHNSAPLNDKKPSPELLISSYFPNKWVKKENWNPNKNEKIEKNREEKICHQQLLEKKFVCAS